MRSRGHIVAIALLFVLLGAVTAEATSDYEARARRPAYDPASLELVGAGVYRTEAPHAELRVTVCLRKRFGRRSFAVRCETSVDSGRKVKGQVSVPGCVPGVWRTTVEGDAMSRSGESVNHSVAVSRRYRCPA